MEKCIILTSISLCLIAMNFVHTVSTASDLDIIAFPQAWSDMCTYRRQQGEGIDVYISCYVTSRDKVMWRLVDLRRALNFSSNQTEIKVSVDIRCETGGNISLPWPMLAPGMIQLKVHNCRLLDKYADFNTSDQFLNQSLQVLELTDCIWVNQPGTLEFMMANLDKITSSYDCGQDKTLVIHRLINLTDEINNPSTEMMANLPEQNTSIGEDALNTLTSLQNLDTTCNFRQLLVLDESLSYPLSRDHFEFLVQGSKFPVLNTLNYSGVGMDELPRELKQWQRYFPQLRMLDLAGNKLKAFSLEEYGTHSPLYVNLTNNNFTQISLAMVQDWATDANVFVDIRSNPVVCDCQLRLFLQQLRNEKLWMSAAMSVYYQYLPDLTCASPEGLAGRRVGSLNYSELPCVLQTPDLRVVMAVLAALAFILLVLLVLAVRYRREVRILMFTRIHVLLPCGPPLPDIPEEKKKKYDAFVAYSQEDSDWVINTLCPRLEKASSKARDPCRLCIHQRDFTVGKPIIDNIIDSIASSKHTIIVLSPNFLKSKWAMEELNHAYRHSLEERKRHLVIVVLGDLDKIEMTPLLKRCCKTFTYLHVSDMLFWDRLLYSLQVEEQKMKITAHSDISKTPPNCTTISEDSGKINLTNLTPPDKDGTTTMDVKNVELKQALFLETKRALSIDSARTVCSDDSGMPLSPDDINIDLVKFISHA